MSRSLQVCIVVYHSDVTWLTKTLTSLRAAVELATARQRLTSASVQIVDNGTETPHTVNGEAQINAAIDDARRASAGTAAIDFAYVAMPENLGFGAANNRALSGSTADFVLVLNPDVELATESIANAIAHFDRNAACGAITPVASSPDGEPQYLVKRDPSVGVLALRGFAPCWLKQRFSGVLCRYDYRDVSFDSLLANCRIVSGCFLLLRGDVWQRSDGFDETFFLYFEDFDLSRRISAFSRIDRVVDCRVVHAGGNASAKGPKHIGMFVRSAVRFFNKHGWRW